MREILFRGKRIYDDKWSESVCPSGEMHIGVVTHDYFPESVGQYTGLNDKNGKKIFEGDIVKGYINCEKFIGYVVFRNGSFFVEEKGFGCYGIAFGNTTNWEVIGNIFDDPELLKEGE